MKWGCENGPYCFHSVVWQRPFAQSVHLTYPRLTPVLALSLSRWSIGELIRRSWVQWYSSVRPSLDLWIISTISSKLVFKAVSDFSPGKKKKQQNLARLYFLFIGLIHCESQSLDNYCIRLSYDVILTTMALCRCPGFMSPDFFSLGPGATKPKLKTLRKLRF